MSARLEFSTASQANQTKSQVEKYSRLITAGASEELGRELNIAVMAEAVGSTNDDRAPGIAVDSIVNYFKAHVTSDVSEAVTQAIHAANDAILLKQRDDPSFAGQGATVTLAITSADRLYVAGVGQGRVFLVRDGDVRTITIDQTWMMQAIESWAASTRDLQNYASTLSDYLGKKSEVEPQFAPIDFLWEGDTLVLVTTSVASRVDQEAVRDLIVGRPLDESAKNIVELAIERDGVGNLTTMVIRVPGRVRTPAPIPAGARLRLSPAAKGLIVGNAILILLVAAMLIRSGGINAIFQPYQGVEVAKPIFAPTPTLLPLEALDVPGEDPFAPTPPSPAAAPTVAPAPTFTPMPTPKSLSISGAPKPLQPANGTVFTGSDAIVVLGWEPIPNLPEDLFYVLAIRKYVDGKLIGESRNWTHSTRIRLDTSFFTSESTQPGRVGVAAPNQTASMTQFQWTVTVYRLTQIQPDGTLNGEPVSPSSPIMTFLWGPKVQPAPTRVYGSENLQDDPFFQAEQRRQSDADAALGPISAGMAGIWLVIGGLIAAPKLVRSRKHSNQRPR